MKNLFTLILLPALCAAPAAVAGSAPGGYAALDVQNWSATNAGAYGNPGTGLRIGGGYRFTSNIAVEADYALSSASTSVAGLSYKASAWQLAAVGSYDVNPQFALFAKVGASNNKYSLSTSGYGGASASTSKTDLLYGIGGQYRFTPDWGVRLQYEHLGKATSTGMNDIKYSTVSLGLVYLF